MKFFKKNINRYLSANKHPQKEITHVMGAIFQKEHRKSTEIKNEKKAYNTINIEEFFRPSCRSVLNNRLFDYHFFGRYYDKKSDEIVLPPALMDSPENAILNYFSILREAVNFTANQFGGCGTVGQAKHPFPIAYNFFTQAYQQKVPFPKYFSSFEGIAHTNLIKLYKLPKENPNQTMQFFVELETINGTSTGISCFQYHYGYVSIVKENAKYKIDNISLLGEDFLCAAYHGWSQKGEGVVDVEYGNWCNLVKKRLPTKRDGYVKTIDVSGTDENDYRFVFIQLTNDTDILISQFKKKKHGQWEVTKIDPLKCVQNKKES